MTSSARLEILFDTETPTIDPKLSRCMPAALYGYVEITSFHQFCDTMDTLLALLAADFKRRRIRFWLMFLCIYFWWFLSIGLVGSEETFEYFQYLFYFFLIVTSLVWIFTSYILRGPMTSSELMQKIHDECQAMTDRTPNVSFHVVLMPIRGWHGGCLVFNTIDHIAVSIANPNNSNHNNNHMSMKDNNEQGPNGKKVINNDYQRLEVV